MLLSDTNELQQLGKNVRDIRVSILKCTISEFSKITGVSRDVVCRLEDLRAGGNDKTCPTIVTILKVCQSLNISIGDILGNDIISNIELVNTLKCMDFVDRECVSYGN